MPPVSARTALAVQGVLGAQSTPRSTASCSSSEIRMFTSGRRCINVQADYSQVGP